MKMSCKKIEDRLFDYYDGLLDDDERAAVHVHLAICRECRRIAELCAGLPRAVATAPMPPMDPALERRALDPSSRLRVVSSRPSRSRRSRLVAAVSLPVAAAAAFLLLAPVSPFSLLGPDAPDGVAGTPAPDQEWLEGGRFELSKGVSVWFEAGTEASLDDPRSAEPSLNLKRGGAVIEISDSSPIEALIVETPSGKVVARGAVLSVSAAGDGGGSVRAIEGRVEVAGYSLERGAIELLAGQQVSSSRGPLAASPGTMAQDIGRVRGHDESLTVSVEAHLEREAARSDSGSAPDALLRLARAYRSVSDFATAARVYESLIETHPDSEAGINAMVSLGQMELMFMGDEEAAARHFSRYLEKRPDGSLASVAEEGRTRALGETR